ncbi:MAG: ABC transporter ATP-binding protein/permease [Pirellula sp.]|nr:ABC transporter ATP-binding protein/permease [Pirellula sp.]
MRNFGKAIREAAPLAPLILLATICSFGIAVLWGSNIGALYPVIEITLRNESIQSWLDKKHAETRADLDRLTIQIQEVENKVPKDKATELELIELRQLREERERTLAWTAWQRDWANRLLPNDAFQTICVIMGVLVVTTLVKHVLMLTSDMILGYVSSTLVKRLRQRVFQKSLAMDRDAYQSVGTSGLVSSITVAADNLTTGLMSLFGAAIREPLRIIACLAFACFISWRLLALSIFLAPALIVIIVYFNKKIRAVASAILKRNAGFHEVMLEAFSNIFTVQAYSMQECEQKRFASRTDEMQRASLRMIFFSGLSRPFTELIGVTMVGITVCAGAYLVVNKETHLLFLKIRDTPLSITDLLIFFGLLIGASDPLRRLSGVSVSIQNGAMAANVLYGILEHPTRVTEPLQGVVLSGRQNSLSVEQLSFEYQSGTPILEDISLTIPFGKTVAILGHNGSGKSTLIQLLCRFYDPTRGRITLGGVDLRDLSFDDIRKRITLVGQNAELFNRTVLENIQYGSVNATRQEIFHAAKLAHAHDFITNSLPDGYETIVGTNGQKLSGGQRQRIALARAILRKPEILILDESTSQIDLTSEVQIRETLEAMKGTMTIIIVTHREALLKMADNVYQIQGGKLSAHHQSLSERVA